MERLCKHFSAQIFATNLDREAVDIARAGMYLDGIAVDVNPKRLGRFFIREDGSAETVGTFSELFGAIGVLGRERGDTVHIYGWTRQYLAPAPGSASRCVGLA